MNAKEVKRAKEEFVEWCFKHANDYDIGRFELAQEVWMKKEAEIIKLKKELVKQQKRE